MANMAVSRIKREFKEVIKSEEVSSMPFLLFSIAFYILWAFHRYSKTILSAVEIDKF